MTDCTSPRWHSATLGEMLTFQRGYDITKKEQRPGPYAVISSSGPGSFHAEYKVKGPGVVIGRKGTLGTVFFSASSFWPHDTTLWVKDFHGNDEKFAYYFLKTLRLEQYDCGASNPTVNRNHIHPIPVCYPEVSVQCKIAGVLSAYDDLIENNTRRIEILEEMAQAIYREWFVNFRFPGHEKAKMVDSPLGPIPEGWRVVPLKALVQNLRDSTRSGSHLDDRYYVPIDCIPRRSMALLEAKPWTEAQSSLQLFEPCDILFGAMRPYFHKVVLAPFKGVTRSTCFVLRPRDTNLVCYALLSIFRDDTIAFATAHSQGTTIPYAVWEGSLAEMEVVLPPEGVLRQFAQIVEPMISMLQSAFFRLGNLRQTRDLLLPKLISGEVDVSELDIVTGGQDE